MRLNNKRIVVTGATGLIGSNLLKKLLNEGADVVAVGRSEKKIRDVFFDFLNNPYFSYLVFDVSKEIPKELGNVDYLFHAASPIAGEEIRCFPVNVINANLAGTINCLEFLKGQKEEGKTGKLIIFSSATVYGNKQGRDISVLETDTTVADSLDSGNSPYSESKRMIEVISRAYFKQYGIDSSIIRISYVYGFSKIVPNTAFYQFIDSALKGKDIVIHGVGMARRDNIYVDDVVEALVQVCKYGAAGEVYNISSSGEKNNYIAIDEIADIVASTVNSLVSTNTKVIKRQMENKERAPGVILNNQKLQQLGWNLTTSIEEGIQKTVRLYVDNSY